MSEVFEGIVVSQRLSEIEADNLLDASLVRDSIGDQASVFYRSDNRSDLEFSIEIEDIARSVAEQLGSAVVVRYDSRLGHRSSVVFRKDTSPQRYDPVDELFVPLDESGEPMAEVEPLRFEELEESAEYETSTNAIELGLRAIDGPTWHDLRSFIAAH